ncbi:TIGR04086 family membrane protein [Bacillus pumilus]|uniref:TIGR04086 family membrane protein n=1 Tax=Bacillus pumilus TaxID=1408 RepID=UPI00119D3B9E|nr:TIGR04086 family membrane protein [Bacillus pumilus]
MQETKQIGKGILSGLMAIFIVMIVTSLLVSLMLTFTSMQEASFKWMIMLLSFVALLLGGIISGGKAKERGWLIGAITSLTFSVTVFLFQYLGFGETFSPEQFIYHGAFLGICMFGGMIGVNLRGK